MPEIHLVSVFIGPDGAGGNPLAVFLDGQAIPPARRLAVTAELGYSETVFVDDLAEGRIAIFVPTSELPFAGHPTVGTAWLLHEIGRPVATLRVPAGAVPAWRDAQWTWVRARPRWVDFRVKPNFVQMATATEVDALPRHTDQPWLYAWAWLDEGTGRLRARSFPTWAGIDEDEASGAAAVLMGAALGRELQISQGVGSEIVARPGPGGTVEIGGRCNLVEVREYVGHALMEAWGHGRIRGRPPGPSDLAEDDGRARVPGQRSASPSSVARRVITLGPERVGPPGGQSAARQSR